MESALTDRAILPKRLPSPQLGKFLKLSLQNAISNFTTELEIFIHCQLVFFLVFFFFLNCLFYKADALQEMQGNGFDHEAS